MICRKCNFQYAFTHECISDIFATIEIDRSDQFILDNFSTEDLKKDFINLDERIEISRYPNTTRQITSTFVPQIFYQKVSSFKRRFFYEEGLEDLEKSEISVVRRFKDFIKIAKIRHYEEKEQPHLIFRKTEKTKFNKSKIFNLDIKSEIKILRKSAESVLPRSIFLFKNSIDQYLSQNFASFADRFSKKFNLLISSKFLNFNDSFHGTNFYSSIERVLNPTIEDRHFFTRVFRQINYDEFKEEFHSFDFDGADHPWYYGNILEDLFPFSVNLLYGKNHSKKYKIFFKPCFENLVFSSDHISLILLKEFVRYLSDCGLSYSDNRIFHDGSKVSSSTTDSFIQKSVDENYETIMKYLKVVFKNSEYSVCFQ